MYSSFRFIAANTFIVARRQESKEQEVLRAHSVIGVPLYVAGKLRVVVQVDAFAQSGDCILAIVVCANKIGPGLRRAG